MGGFKRVELVNSTVRAALPGTRVIIFSRGIYILSRLMRKKRICTEFNQVDRKGGGGRGNKAEASAGQIASQRGVRDSRMPGRKTSRRISADALHRAAADADFKRLSTKGKRRRYIETPFSVHPEERHESWQLNGKKLPVDLYRKV